MQKPPIILPEVIIIEPKIFGDARGFFYESFQAKRYLEEYGIPVTFVQDNVSRSTKGILRGLHHQKQHTQGKLICVTRGAVFDVAVDIRQGSPNFGQWMGVVLDDKKHRQVYIPPGFAHGFCVLSEEADFIYKCTDYYDPSSEITIKWDDPDLAIDWPIENPILSTKDQKGILLKNILKTDLPYYEN
jgi:dTDP-4-dehydrorhamnose 3,5-epimerase